MIKNIDNLKNTETFKSLETSISQITTNLKDPKKIKEKLQQLGVSSERIEEVIKSIRANKVVKSAGIQELVSRMRNHMVVNVLTQVDEIRKNAVKQVAENSRNIAGQLQSLVKTKRTKPIKVKTSSKKGAAKKVNAKKPVSSKTKPKTKSNTSKKVTKKTTKKAKRTSK